MIFYTYILECADGSLYTGWTNNLENRLVAHNNGKGAKYTKGRLPVRLVYWEKHECRKEAQRREMAIKKLVRHKKEKLLAEFIP